MGSASSPVPARVYLVAGAVVCAAYLFLSSAVQNVVYDAVAVSTGIALILGPLHAGVRPLGPWVLMGAGLLAFAAGDIVYTVDELVLQVETPFPSVADVLYLAGYPLIAAGVVGIVRRRTPGRDRSALIDASIISLGTGVIAWVFVAAPYTRDASLGPLAKMVSVGYPLMDLLVLAVMVRLVVGGGVRNTSLRFLCAGAGALLAADIAYASSLFGGGYVSGGFLDLVWLVSYVVWGTAALDPSVRTLADRVPTSDERLTRTRLAALAVAAVAAPTVGIIDAVRGDGDSVPLVFGASAALFVFVLLRLAGLTRAVQQNAERLRAQRIELSETVEELRKSERERGRLLERVMRIADEEREGREIAEQARVSLEALRERQVRFATMAAHEIRTPVTALLGSLWTLERCSAMTEEQDRDLLSASVRQARKLARLCEDLLVVSETTRDSLYILAEDVAVADVVAEAIAELGSAAERRVHLAFEPGTRVYADPYRLNQILTNLIRNALQYSPDESPVDVAARALEDGRVEITVSDRGPGIQPDELPVLFDRFGHQKPDAHSGLGVGLWIVRRLVVAMSGEVTAGANEAGGALLTVRLPERWKPAQHALVG